MQISKVAIVLNQSFQYWKWSSRPERLKPLDCTSDSNLSAVCVRRWTGWSWFFRLGPSRLRWGRLWLESLAWTCGTRWSPAWLGSGAPLLGSSLDASWSSLPCSATPAAAEFFSLATRRGFSLPHVRVYLWSFLWSKAELVFVSRMAVRSVALDLQVFPLANSWLSCIGIGAGLRRPSELTYWICHILLWFHGWSRTASLGHGGLCCAV